MQIKIEHDGLTVKDWLYQNGVSRAMITRLKKSERGILVNGEHVTVRRALNVGDTLELDIADTDADRNEFLVPTEMPLDIVYEDERMIAVNKPPEMPTHPSLGHFDDTLANGLAHYFAAQNIPFVFRAINRLDRNTSGVVLCAKNQLAASELSALLQSGRIQKRYLALLNGRLTPESGFIDAPIRRLSESIILRGVCKTDEPGAKESLTRYETLETFENCTLVRAEPITGRTHQLRVHFAHRGAPIVGDGLYGSAESSPTQADSLIARHALHAESLEIAFPDIPLKITASAPEDFRALTEKLRNSR